MPVSLCVVWSCNVGRQKAFLICSCGSLRWFLYMLGRQICFCLWNHGATHYAQCSTYVPDLAGVGSEGQQETQLLPPSQGQVHSLWACEAPFSSRNPAMRIGYTPWPYRPCIGFFRPGLSPSLTFPGACMWPLTPLAAPAVLVLRLSNGLLNPG